MLGVLGGALAFGLLGIFVGPVLLGVGFTLVAEFAGEDAAAAAVAGGPVRCRRAARPSGAGLLARAAHMFAFILSPLLQAVPVLLVVGVHRLRACSRSWATR